MLVYTFLGFVGKVCVSRRQSTKNELIKIIITIITTVKSYRVNGFVLQKKTEIEKKVCFIFYFFRKRKLKKEILTTNSIWIFTCTGIFDAGPFQRVVLPFLQRKLLHPCRLTCQTLVPHHLW